MSIKLRVSIPDQTVAVVQDGQTVWCAPVSTSVYGTGSEQGSFRTPVGRFVVAERIGEGAPVGARFVGRVFTGYVWQPGEGVDEDWILTRILWLDGLDPENSNTKSRYIYFHGTNHEDRIGIPTSHGCIRLRNADMVTLFDWTPLGAEVWIG
ncbi:MAG: L,D-transpeptidase [Candidatus Methylacidiphilales bacterium]